MPHTEQIPGCGTSVHQFVANRYQGSLLQAVKGNFGAHARTHARTRAHTHTCICTGKLEFDIIVFGKRFERTHISKRVPKHTSRTHAKTHACLRHVPAPMSKHRFELKLTLCPPYMYVLHTCPCRHGQTVYRHIVGHVPTQVCRNPGPA